MKKTKNERDGTILYSVGRYGYAYNRTLHEWEVYEMHEADGSIQELIDRVRTKAEAHEWAVSSQMEK